MLVTSDNPFIVEPPSTADPTLEGTGALSPGATNLIPLSSTTLLCARSDGSGLLRFLQANRDLVRYVNQRVASASDCFILTRDEPLLRRVVKVTKADQWRNAFMPAVVAPEMEAE